MFATNLQVRKLSIAGRVSRLPERSDSEPRSEAECRNGYVSQMLTSLDMPLTALPLSGRQEAVLSLRLPFLTEPHVADEQYARATPKSSRLITARLTNCTIFAC